MLRTRVALVSFVLFVGLACAGETTPDPVSTPDPVVEQPAPAPTRGGKHKGKGGKRRGKAGAADDVVAAFVEDCAAVFTVDDEGGGAADECTWREFDQNCAPDTFGCFDQGQACQDDCQPRCVGCQATCAGTCEDCKSACDGKGPACVRACAEKRAACRTDCMAGKEDCEGACQKAESTCYSDAQKELEKKCPRCGDLNACQYEKMSEGKEREDCLKEFPDHAAECLDLCYEP
ncbi:MAG: hypothetical protein KC621_18930 [Myxococcales bacterium]|nr:hypothetical protein [Myxococcales bacterium]